MVVGFGSLVKVSLVGCAACLGMGYAFHRNFVQTMKENPLYKEAIETVRSHKGAVYLLGEPIEPKNPVLANSGMLISGYSDVQVRVSGPKSDGIVFLKVVQGDKEKVKIEAIHLQIGTDYSKRLVIKDTSKEVQKEKN